MAAASTSSRPEGAVVAAASESGRAEGVVAATPRARTSGQVEWGSLTKQRLRRELTPTRLRSTSPPPRTRSPSQSGSPDRQSDESELSAEERSFEDEQEQELDVREAAQRLLGEQRLVELSRPPSPPKETRPQRVLPAWKSALIQSRKQLEDAKENERKLQKLLRTRKRDITRLRSLRTDTFEGPPTFYEETILRLNNQLQMLRRDTADHNEEKKLMEGRERGHVEVMKEKSRMHLRAIEAYNDLRKRSTARYAEYEASIKLRDETESQLRNQLQGVAHLAAIPVAHLAASRCREDR